jgi:hypothetical protein
MIEFKPEDPGFTADEIPPQVEIAFRAVAYCRSLTDPQSIGLPPVASRSRSLTAMELGVESAALNVIRNYLNGEMTYRDYSAMVEPDQADTITPKLPSRRARKSIAKPAPAEDTGSSEEAGK